MLTATCHLLLATCYLLLAACYLPLPSTCYYSLDLEIVRNVSGNLNIFSKKLLRNEGLKQVVLCRNLSDDGELSKKQNWQCMQAEEIMGISQKLMCSMLKEIVFIEIPETMCCLTL